MNSRQTRARRSAANGRRSRAPLLVIGGTLLILAIAGLMLPGWTPFRTEASLPLGTDHVMGRANAPVEVEEWSDFQ